MAIDKLEKDFAPIERKPMEIKTWYYIDFEVTEVDMGDYIIVGDQYKPHRHLIDKSVRKSFKNNREKLSYRKHLFDNLKNDTWYGKWFATETRKGVLFGYMIDFCNEFIEKTIDLNQGEIFVAVRNLNLNGSMAHINSKNQGYIDEILNVFQKQVRWKEEGIVEIPFRTHTHEDYLELLRRRK